MYGIFLIQSLLHELFQNFRYSVKYRGLRYEVCKMEFRKIYGITDGKIQHLTGLMLGGEILFLDRRGTHDNRPHTVALDIHDAVVEHINSFQTYVSHYVRQEGEPERLYLDPGLSLSKMYDIFLQMRRNAEEPECYEHYYRHIFMTEFNLKFGQPKQDCCDYCDRFNARIKIARDLNNDDEVEFKKLLI